ncbi:helix-turn-helix domain-containing protein [Anaerotruncus rubiinfantis]|uniref:helix-turn-helix domain-containing protein n=1 Tax=Anaerotruncus rubiinfantis TaxID=1720200 RepID=UPI0018986137|nr:helix-turn-helix domain-containing protein [Anaerotruncus rubiinfantis]
MGKQKLRSKEEKINIVKRHLSGEAGRALERETGIRHEQIRQWTARYLAEGETGLEPKKRPGNPLSRYERRKELTYEEQLQYQIELLKRELLQKESEVQRLKKLNARKGGDARIK